MGHDHHHHEHGSFFKRPSQWDGWDRFFYLGLLPGMLVAGAVYYIWEGGAGVSERTEEAFRYHGVDAKIVYEDRRFTPKDDCWVEIEGAKIREVDALPIDDGRFVYAHGEKGCGFKAKNSKP